MIRIRTSVRKPYRCTKCRARKSAQQPPKKCRKCGHDKVVIDQYRLRKEWGVSCSCHGYPFPHRPGCEPWCIDSKRPPTDEEYREYYGLPL